MSSWCCADGCDHTYEAYRNAVVVQLRWRQRRRDHGLGYRGVAVPRRAAGDDRRRWSDAHRCDRLTGGSGTSDFDGETLAAAIVAEAADHGTNIDQALAVASDRLRLVYLDCQDGVLVDLKLAHGEFDGMAVGLVQVIDGFLIAAGLLIFALGLYELFIGDIELPQWLVIQDLDALKAKLAGIIVMVIAVTFLERLESADPRGSSKRASARRWSRPSSCGWRRRSSVRVGIRVHQDVGAPSASRDDRDT